MSDPFALAPPPAPGRARQRARTATQARAHTIAGWVLGLGVPLAAVVVMTALLVTPTDKTPLSIANPRPDGAMALAQVLRQQGVAVTPTDSTASAVARADGDVTLAIVAPDRLSDHQLELYAKVKCAVVLIEPSPLLSEHLQEELSLDQLSIIVDGAMVTNSRITRSRNAAEALRLLGQHRTLIWNMASYEDEQGGQANLWDMLPPWARIVALQLVIAVAGAAAWRGRRMGRVVPDELPVTVPASQLTVGLGHLYGRARALGHAAAALRAGAASRIGTALGLPTSAEPATLVAGTARATNRTGPEISHLLYGPAPGSGAELAALAKALDQLVEGVFRP
ncbi:MAG: DUF4350 domain-containing protein [Bifidobacteriaceae bacterium]|jgi:hypothetical protein|nr:DUF4350 domain-containing protein [Bifidobacteriaceae bacterium]